VSLTASGRNPATRCRIGLLPPLNVTTLPALSEKAGVRPREMSNRAAAQSMLAIALPLCVNSSRCAAKSTAQPMTSPAAQRRLLPMGDAWPATNWTRRKRSMPTLCASSPTPRPWRGAGRNAPGTAQPICMLPCVPSVTS